jgi:7-carboxy-7-deazaguanine synthase
MSASTTTYPVMEAFYTLQGEGYYTGHAAYFIRLGGCDVGCVWCDVKDSWDADKHPQKSVSVIVAAAKQYNAQLIVVTGGEPCMHQLDALCVACTQEGFVLNIETSGSAPISGTWNWICLSPKKFKAPLPENLSLAHELKIIVFNKSDFEWAEQYAAQVSSHCKLYLQPEWSKMQEVMPLIIDYIQKNPKWQLSLQTHKWIGIE